ncbi:MAG: hypothetical protein KDD40_10895, partial [Bdellovibrionales bacterium]|nr:hypothetical protein [Bdellovibrionales bacterium]
STHKGFVKYDIKNFELVEGAKLSKNQKYIADKVIKGESVEFATLTEEMVAVHHRAEVKKTKKKLQESQAISTVAAIASAMTPVSSFEQSKMGEFKVSYEKFLEDIHNKELAYNLDAINIFDILEKGKMQCYSGTYLNQVNLRNYVSHVSTFDSLEPVVIYESGHVLPGFMQKDKQGDWTLLGIETTLAGQAQKIYGKVKELDIPVRIFLAHDFALNEIFKGLLKKEIIPVKAQSMATGNTKLAATACMSKIDGELANRAASKYGIPLQRLEQKIFASEGKNCAAFSNIGGSGTPQQTVKSTQSTVALNESSLGFGKSDVPPGDIKRQKVDVIPANLVGFSGARIFNEINEKEVLKGAFGKGRCVPPQEELETNYEISDLDPRACSLHDHYREKYNEKNNNLALFAPVRLNTQQVRAIKNRQSYEQLANMACQKAYGDSGLQMVSLEFGKFTGTGVSLFVRELPKDSSHSLSSYNEVYIDIQALASMFGFNYSKDVAVLISELYTDSYSIGNKVQTHYFYDGIGLGRSLISNPKAYKLIPITKANYDYYQSEERAYLDI